MILRCSCFGFNKTVLKLFSDSIGEIQETKDKDEEGDDDDDEKEGDSGTFVLRIQRYFRHMVMWLAQDTVADDIPLVVQDALLRMVLVFLRPHEIEDVLGVRKLRGMGWVAIDRLVRRRYLGCIDASDSESRLIVQHFRYLRFYKIRIFF